ncbi:hypothetical protein FPRO04_14111 [Fusarium proliferatum]|nr:hypothetical protein FPRO04_14111 [Fusarium proliferatum]
MKFNGKIDGHGFYVIMSKRDDLQRSKAQKTDDKAIRKYGKTSPSESGEHLSALRMERDQLAQAFQKADTQLEQHEARKSKFATDISYISDWLHHLAVQTREACIIQRILADFSR